MNAADPDPTSASDFKVSAPSHATRNFVILGGVALAIAIIFMYSHANAQRDEKKLTRFDAFRAAYAEKCNVPSYANTQPEVVNNDYLTSPGIQAEVDRQLAALNSGASCEAVVAKLKAVDLAVPLPPGAQ
jgi:hypothetical protein